MSFLQLKKYMSRRTRGYRLVFLLGVFAIGFLSVNYVSVRNPQSFPKYDVPIPYSDTNHPFIHRHLLSDNSTTDEGIYPPSLFTLEQMRQGAVILHVFGMVYMFVALAIVCDEFFVPALGVIIEKYDISEDVAGATFMAAGGSAPEFFTSIIGVFLAKSNVGIGTIVGSAVFNILFVIGMCAVFSKQLLVLTWWPLFRDVTFYSIDLVVLIGFFSNEVIEWWEALILFFLYLAYVIFMKFNENIERFVKGCTKKTSMNKVASTDTLLKQKGERRCSLPILHAGSSRFRHGVLQLMIHTIDPLGPEKVQDKAVALHAMASLQLMINMDSKDGAKQNGNVDQDNNMQVNVISNGKVSPAYESTGSLRKGSPCVSQETALTMVDQEPDQNGKVTRRDVNVAVDGKQEGEDEAQSSNDSKSETPGWEEEEEPLDMSWPDTCRKRCTYIFLAPIVFPLWLFLPDVRRKEKKKWFLCTFIGSILSIAIFSYLMVWWASETGTTAGIEPEVMGLTFLAAGTSIPDLITSVIVAKKGYGDMAVSSSVGSNIFDITVGLPIPWLLWSATQNGAAINVSSKGLLCSIVLLFIMLLAVIVTIAVSKWKMSRTLGGIMFLLYIVFITLSVLLEIGIITCPDTK
ncbi:sodium/potassium/calcium exchanger 2-like [Haliotis cracherodii]|uniref:sodium/potassium/calcium exchanger 2-like n=1 Tax=Haliotis cracherodii TaxID=6455 RepID=UPI0039ED88E5